MMHELEPQFVAALLERLDPAHRPGECAVEGCVHMSHDVLAATTDRATLAQAA